MKWVSRTSESRGKPQIFRYKKSKKKGIETPTRKTKSTSNTKETRKCTTTGSPKTVTLIDGDYNVQVTKDTEVKV